MSARDVVTRVIQLRRDFLQQHGVCPTHFDLSLDDLLEVYHDTDVVLNEGDEFYGMTLHFGEGPTRVWRLNHV